MQSVTDIAREIVAREGGFVNDPADPGGATNHGVTLVTMRRLGLDLTGDGRVSAADVRRLSPAQAEEIFVEHYFRAPGLAGLPEALQASVFDMYVNAGSNAVKVLQRLLNEMGSDLTVDGAVGPATIAAAQRAAERDPALLADAYGIARRNYYYALADARRRAASSPAARTAARAAGSPVPRNSSRPASTSARPSTGKGRPDGRDRPHPRGRPPPPPRSARPRPASPRSSPPTPRKRWRRRRKPI